MNDRQEKPALTYERHRTHTSSGGHSSRHGRYLNHQSSGRRSHRRRRRKLNPNFILAILALLAILIGIVVGVRSCGANTLKGRWDLDGTTIYKFDRNGTGALVLMYNEYAFEYTIEGDRLYIDFADEAALDASYTFKVDGRMLFLTGGPGDARTEYVLTRIL